MDGALRQWGGKAVERQADRLGLGCVSSSGPLEILNQRTCQEQRFRKMPSSCLQGGLGALESRWGSSGAKISDRQLHPAQGGENWTRCRDGKKG